MKKILLICLITSISSLSFAQVRQNVKQDVKLNATSLLAWRILEAQYEYAFHPKWSVQLGAGFRIPSGFGLSAAFPDLDFDQGETNPFATDLRLTGFRFTPEIKFYPGNNKEAPQGFYLAGYARYYNYSLQTGNFIADIDNSLEEADARFSISALTFGGGIGTQWVLNNNITLDVMWLGFSLGSGNIDIRLNSNNENIDWEQAAENAENDSDFEDAREIEALNDGIRARFRNPLAFGLRTSLSVGYAF